MTAPRRHQRWHPLYHERAEWLPGWAHALALWLDRGSRDRYYRRAAARRR